MSDLLENNVIKIVTEHLDLFFYRGGNTPQGVWTSTFLGDGFQRITGYTLKEFHALIQDWRVLIHKDDQDRVFKEAECLQKRECTLTQEYRIKCMDGSERWVTDYKSSHHKNGEVSVDGLVIDSTDKKKSEEYIAKLNRELRIKNEELEISNSSLRRVISQIESDKMQLRMEVAEKIEDSILPHLEKLLKGLEGVDNNLYEIASVATARLKRLHENSLGQKALANKRVTHTEKEICSLIKDGKSSQEIANLLSISVETVKTHRRNIRKKLEIPQGENLYSYLMSLSR